MRARLKATERASVIADFRIPRRSFYGIRNGYFYGLFIFDARVESRVDIFDRLIILQSRVLRMIETGINSDFLTYKVVIIDYNEKIEKLIKYFLNLKIFFRRIKPVRTRIL